MAINNKIKQLRTSRKWSQETLARKVGYADKTAIAKIEKGLIDLPQSKIKAFSDVFNVSISYLIDDEETTNVRTHNRSDHFVTVPVFGTIRAGIPEEAVEDIIDYIDVEVSSSYGEYLGLEIKGDSMSPDFIDGDYIILKKQSDCESGDLAAVLVNGNEATFKKIKKLKDGVMLIPLNSAYETMFYSNKDIVNLPVTIIGVLVEMRRHF